MEPLIRTGHGGDQHERSSGMFDVDFRLTRGNTPIARLMLTVSLFHDPDPGKPPDALQPEGEPRA